MLPERQYFSPIEKELHFNQWSKDRNINLFLFDLDDTICITGPVFDKQTTKAVDLLATNNPIISREEWQKEITNTNNQLFEKLGVNPDKYQNLVNELNKKFNLNPKIRQQTLEIFQQIYTTPLEMLDGAREGLKFLKKVGMPTGIVTHANRRWTYEKHQWLGLKDFVDWDNDVYVVDENGHKNSESWQKALDYFKAKPEHCAVIGDSPRSDINPTQKIGVKQTFLVETSSLWSVHNQPVHSSTIRIKNLSELIGLGTEKL